MSKKKNVHAVALGRKGGRAGKGKTSLAKAAAARENGKKGGRPRLALTAAERSEKASNAARWGK